MYLQRMWPVGISQDQELRPDFEDLSPEAAWQSVLETIEQHERGRHKHRLHLAAVQAALAKEHRLKLPPALLAPFQVCPHPPQKSWLVENDRLQYGNFECNISVKSHVYLQPSVGFT